MKGWIQGANAADKSGKVALSVYGKDAKSFCINGAILRVVKEGHWTDQSTLLRAVAAQMPDSNQIPAMSVVDWNDMEGRTKADVLSVIDKAIKAAA